MKKFVLILTLLSFISFVFSGSFMDDKLNEQDELLNELEMEMNAIKTLVASLKKDNADLIIYSESLEKRIEVCNEKIDKMQRTIDSMKKALISNKEDTKELVNVIGEMQMELDNYKRYITEIEQKSKRANMFIQIAIPTLSIPMIANGVYLYSQGDESYGKICMYGGIGLFVGAEVVWNGGKFILKVW